MVRTIACKINRRDWTDGLVHHLPIVFCVEGRALATTDIPLRFWKRYVDDTCTALPRSRCQELLEHLNSTEATIQFTLELESEGKLPFLDVLLQHHGDGSISTSVFRKPTHTGTSPLTTPGPTRQQLPTH